MAAGLGFKDFTTGEVLTAADVDGYLMQGIWVFASAAARDAAVTAPAEGNFAFTKDNNSLWYYDGAAWVASGATGDIEGVTAGVGISGGGTSGTVTITNSMATAIDAKGDLVVGTGADTFSRLAVGGTNGHVLTVDSGEATGIKWAAVSGGSSGLTLITTQAFTGSSSQSINDCFSNTYTNYRIMFYLTDASAQTNIQARLRVSGSDATGANYNRAGYLQYSTTLTYDNAQGETSWTFSGANKDADGLCTEAVAADIFRPYLAKKTAMNLLSNQNVDTGRARNLVHTADTSYTGITFYPATGTMTGSVSIYGYSI